MSIIPWTFKDGANGGGPLDFPGQRKQSHLETTSPRGRASSSPRRMSPTEKSQRIKPAGSTPSSAV